MSESKLLDATSGHHGDGVFENEQYWDIAGELLVRISIRYSRQTLEDSSAQAVVLATEETGGKQSDLILREFPSHWWPEILYGTAEEMRSVTDAVAARLVTRMETVASALLAF